MATDFTITVDDRPGGLASIGEALGNAGVNIEGVSGLGFEGRGIIHICVMDAATARQALDAAGLKIEGEADAILTESVPGAEQPGTLGMMTRRIAEAGINIRALYLATGSRGVVVTDDNDKARSMMGG
jgi:hypothetical protein